LQAGGRVRERPREDGKASRVGVKSGRSLFQTEKAHLNAAGVAAIEPVTAADAAAGAPIAVDGGIPEQHRRAGSAEDAGRCLRRAGRACRHQRRQFVAGNAPGQILHAGPELTGVGWMQRVRLLRECRGATDRCKKREHDCRNRSRRAYRQEISSHSSPKAEWSMVKGGAQAKGR
jgi:hypothetical protein